jgi:hypothetical protein
MKLTVGDIHMDSRDGIQFRRPQTDAGEQSPRERADREPVRQESVAQLIARLPELPTTLYLIGALVMMAATVALFVAAATTGIIYLVMPTPGLIFLAGLFAARATGWGQPRAPLAAAPDVDRTAEHLALRDERATVEDLMDELDWTEARVVRALKVGIERGRLDEDLDTDTGHWTYDVARPADEDVFTRRALPVDERVLHFGNAPEHADRQQADRQQAEQSHHPSSPSSRRSSP